MSIEELFLSAMKAAGLDPDCTIIADGKLHRFRDREDKAGTQNGYYTLYGDGIPAGVFGSWKKDEAKGTWSSISEKAMDQEQRRQWQEQMNKARRQREEAEIERRTECRKASARLWKAARATITGDLPYILRKKIRPYGAKQLKGSLLLPVRDEEGTLHGLQFIDGEGAKKFKTGTAITGNYLPIGKPSGKLIVVEGWATGCTLHETTGNAVACAFSAGNLKPVCEVLRKNHPDIAIIVAADNDHRTDGNPGVTKAKEAAHAVGALLAIPIFSDPDSNGTDFNDLANEEGADRVKAIIDAAALAPISPTPEKVPEAEGATHEAAPPVETHSRWPEPLLFDTETKTPSLPASLLPGWLGEFCQAVSEATQTPQGMAIMMGLSVVATCAQGRFEVRPDGAGSGYREPLCIWTVTALPPGSRKTAVFEAFTEPLSYVERYRNDSMRRALEHTRVTREAMAKRADALTKKASTIDDERQRTSCITEISSLREEIPAEMFSLNLWCGNVTPERLQMMMVEQNGKMAVLSDEGGVFEIMSGMYSGGNVDLDVFLKGHAGSPLRITRQSREAYLESTLLTFGLCIQPDVVVQLAQGNKKRFRGNGTLARFLWCIPENTVGKRDVSKRGCVPEHVGEAYRAGIKRLLAIHAEKPYALTFDNEARASWLAFSQEVENRQGEHGEFHHIVDWTSKLPGAVARIAGLFHLVQHFDERREINDETMCRALELAELLIDHAKAAFGSMGDDPASGDAKAVLKWIMEKVEPEEIPKFKQRDCHNGLQGRFRNLERLDVALKVLVARHIISEPKKRVGAGRPSIVYYVNPSLFNASRPP